MTWIIARWLATIAGVLYGLDKSFKPFTYFQLLLPIFAAAIVGGLGSPVGAIAGGFVIAFSEVMVTYAWKKVCGYLACPKRLAPDSLRPAAVDRLQVRGQLHDPDHRAAVHADRTVQGEIVMNLRNLDPCSALVACLLSGNGRVVQSWNLAAVDPEHGADLGDHRCAGRQHAMGLCGPLQRRDRWALWRWAGSRWCSTSAHAVTRGTGRRAARGSFLALLSGVATIAVAIAWCASG